MASNNRIVAALGGFDEVQVDWMPATAIRPLVFDDPAVVWLAHHGTAHGYQPERTDYDFIDFIGRKGCDFEAKWTDEMATGAPRICQHPWEGRACDKVRETTELTNAGVPVIAQPALWWAPERIYGVPDLLVKRSWVVEHLPDAELPNSAENDPYLVLDIKFTTNLDSTGKTRDFENYSVQVRLYSFMLGQLQGQMPDAALLITRDRVDRPLVVSIRSNLDGPLDPDLAALRDQYLDIKLNGAAYTPWTHTEVAYSLTNEDEHWDAAKSDIARNRVEGGDPALIYRIGEGAKAYLGNLGFLSLQSLLDAEPADVPLENCPGIGGKSAGRIRAVLQATREQEPVLPPGHLVPAVRPHEFFIDYEFLNNVNVDFDLQWPELEGRELIFMVGVGQETGRGWTFRTFTAPAETPEAEREMLLEYSDFLETETNGRPTDPSVTALYHWSAAERRQSERAADRQGYPSDHPLRNLPWQDLQKVFHNGPASVPGALKFGLKEVANALGSYDAEFATNWPGGLDSGLKAAVMGWRVYEHSEPLEAPEMLLLQKYLEADCQALWNVSRWLRS